MERIYHTWDKWECYPAGFFENRPKDNPKMSEGECKYLYADFLRNIARFEAAMAGVLKDWPNSCEQWLSNERMNRIAWLGHAGCCIAAMSPEENTRCAWHTLTPRQQDVANACALLVLNRWERRHRPPALPLFAWSANHA